MFATTSKSKRVGIKEKSMKINVKKKKKADPFADAFQVFIPEENSKEEIDPKEENEIEEQDIIKETQDVSQLKEQTKLPYSTTPNGDSLNGHLNGSSEIIPSKES
mmetsp:Transcript_19013/g.16849  ORF Transcript_19013/g.16849 Transcript_19013/m.16849 type:complete len:105 (+) Transcript_19013:1212-1526(+)